ncbi:MAG: c-type cytochrome domain-containing protein [Planctomycetota bacterium]|jgi:cytochrome c553
MIIASAPNMLEAMQDPQMRHAAIVHLPIALSVIGVPLVCGAALLGKRIATLRWLAIIVYLTLAGAAWFAAESGEDAESAFNDLRAPVLETLDRHEDMAEKVWIGAIAVTVLLVGTLIPKDTPRRVIAAVAVLASLGLFGWTGQTAHHGGSLVYHYHVLGAAPELGPAPDDDTAPVNTTDETTEPGESDTDSDDDAAGGPAVVEAAIPVDPEVAFFTSHVRPILEANCWKCHNPQRAKRNGKLDLTTRATMLVGGRGGPAVVEGKPDESPMMEYVREEDPDYRMPPEADPLSPEDIATLAQWITDGAAWDDQPAPTG